MVIESLILWSCEETDTSSPEDNDHTVELDTIPPISVELISVTFDNQSFMVNWTQNNDEDFDFYTLLESTNNGMNDSTVVDTFTLQSITSTTIYGVSYEEIRYFQVQVSDSSGNKVHSNVMSGSYMRIVYSSEGNLFTMIPDGSNQVNLTETNYSGFNPIFSQDGTMIIYTGGDSDWEIYLTDINGTDHQNLTNYTSVEYDSDYQDFNPVVSPDGNLVCFVSLRNNGDFDIFTMNIDGSNQTNITNSTGKDGTPIFTPDGQLIIFETRRDGNSELYSMNVDGSNPTNLTNTSYHETLYDNYNVNPLFTLDGQNLIFLSTQDGDTDIFIMGIDGSNPTNLSNNSVFDFYQQVSPDGNYIVFLSLLDDPNIFQVYVMGIDGSNIINVSHEFGYYPTFSPDSKKVIYKGGDDQLYSVNIDGSEKVQLTFDSGNKKDPMFRPIPNPSGLQ